MSYSTEAQFDEQGQFFWATAKIAGWDAQQVEMLMLKKYKISHWNALNQNQKNQMIAIMKKYADAAKKKRKFTKEKGLRQAIMATWKSCGHDIEELHALMKTWGFGESLRACKIDALYTIHDRVKTICQSVKKN